MTSGVLPAPGTAFGDQVHRRLRTEKVIWLTTVGRDGSPQPNPVWFLWTGGEELIVYSRADAHRLNHLRERPAVAVHFDADRHGDGIVVLRGVADLPADVPPCDRSPGYVEKYGSDMVRISGSQAAFAARYRVPIRVRITRVRGH